MFYGRKGIVKVMQQVFPFLIIGRVSETLHMILQSLPLDKQDVSIWLFDAPPEFVRYVTLRRAQDRLCSAK